MEIKMPEQRIIPIALLNPAEYNPRVQLKPGDEEWEKLKRSIQKLGFADPVVVNKDMTIIGGHQRVNVAASLGYTEVPCSVVDLNKDDEKALNVALNKITGRTDNEKLALLLQGLSIGGYDATVTGYSQKECDALISGLKLAVSASDDGYDVEEKLDAIKTPYVKSGQVYQLGKHRVMCGDSTKMTDIEKLMDGEQADLLLTDPPYNVALGHGGSRYEMEKRHRRTDGLLIDNDDMDDDEFIKFLTNCFKNASAAMKPGAVFYIWYADTKAFEFRSACRNIGWQIRQNLIWAKNCFTLGRQDYQWQHEPCLYGWNEGAGHLWASDRKQATVLNFDRPTRSKEHPTMKPIPLFDYQMQNNTKGGDIVLDLFGGSGTTLMAATQNGRVARLMELDPKYCQVIIDRWEQYTGQKAVLISE